MEPGNTPQFHAFLSALFTFHTTSFRLPSCLNKESAWNAGNTEDTGLIPESGRSPRGGHGNPPQYFCLENPMDRGAWWAMVLRVAKSWIWLKWLSTHTHTYKHPTGEAMWWVGLVRWFYWREKQFLGMVTRWETRWWIARRCFKEDTKSSQNGLSLWKMGSQAERAACKY